MEEGERSTPARQNASRRAGPSFQAAREGLSPDEAATFDELAKDYQELALVIHNTPFVAPKVLRELVRVGWRKG